MPFVHIKSLPVAVSGFDISDALSTVSSNLSMATDIPPEFITVTWEYFDNGHYLVGESHGHYHDKGHPLIINILIPDFNSDGAAKRVINSVTESFGLLGFEREEIFINLNLARSGMVYDRGEILEW
ncbi:MAG: hypothetical protein KAG61_11905 [Bacteriovoracaceae bacterium]|nr:hypothetical protein [Bacteriovoracaceae bacterium]